MAILGQLSKCLYCIWPGIIFFAGRLGFQYVNNKTYYGSLTVGVDPLLPQGQGEFETTRMRDAEKRKIIYWCVGVVIAGYLAALAASYFKLI